MTDELPWLGLTEASELTGLNRETLRSRARRGLIPSRRGNAGQVLVQIPTGMTGEATANDQGTTGVMTGNDLGMAEILTELREEIADLRDRLTRAEAERDRAKDRAEVEIRAAQAVAVADVATARAEIRAAERTIARLEAELAEARKPLWRRIMGR